MCLRKSKALRNNTSDEDESLIGLELEKRGSSSVRVDLFGRWKDGVEMR